VASPFFSSLENATKAWPGKCWESGWAHEIFAIEILPGMAERGKNISTI